ncbi:DUF2076 domain-containing protein [Arenibaculum pallidiluteum]|uniref:DUF2076 domain-containing protein n=1 Tax=Arenibaculum pallidiluteum TaxID=2812559 RepID=UPI001A9688B0|nr:DUF2076 domain-containing protein [Arenibaculum pallidiluteum]
MDQTERQIIDELFAKLRQAEAQSGPRDPQAEAHIRDHMARQPAAPYLMAQAIVMLEQALSASQARNQELEQQLRDRPAAGGGGLLAGLFGGGRPAAPQPSRPAHAGSPWGAAPTPGHGDPRLAAYAAGQQRHGGGFMAGAMQTAMGVAGGMLIGNALAGMFSDGEAMAQDAVQQASEHLPEDPGFDDLGFGDEEI